jgi:hypothetical protein
MSAATKFEAIFHEFVRSCGGDVVPEDGPNNRKSADYWFSRHKVVAELKSLVVDQTEGAARKLGKIIDQRRDETPVRRPGPDDIVLPFTSADGEQFTILYDEGLRREWQKVLLTPIENLIRDANRQIRATKERFGVPSAHGVVMIFNEGNPLHAADPVHFARLVGEVIQKPKAAGGRRFPHIQGMIYFSFGSVMTFDAETQKHMPFWVPAQVQGDSASNVKRFQEDLRESFYQRIEQMFGSPVVRHHRETGWPMP